MDIFQVLVLVLVLGGQFLVLGGLVQEVLVLGVQVLVLSWFLGVRPLLTSLKIMQLLRNI